MKAFLSCLLAAMLAMALSPVHAQTWLEPGDRFVRRDGARDDEAFTRGQLGVLLPSYGRKSLYAAYRVLNLPPGATAKESHQRLTTGAVATAPEAKNIWLQARAQVRQDRARAIDYYKPLGQGLQGEFGNCGGHAFETAARLLMQLRADKSFGDSDLQLWVQGQDAVFDQCAWAPGLGLEPAMPAALPDSASARLRALRQYQRAAAWFYRGDFEAARSAFEGIVAEPAHPLRRLAVLGVLRSTVRAASLNPEWDLAFQKAYGEHGLRDQDLRNALAGARQRRQALHQRAQADLESRASQFLKDPELTVLQPQIREIVMRGAQQLAPERLLAWLFDALDHLERNPYAQDTLDQWDQLYSQVVPRGFGGSQADAARRAHPFFDWQLSIQACDDSSRRGGSESSGDTNCRAEHARAQQRWQAERSNVWLVATMLTLRQPGTDDLDAIEAARRVPAADAASWTLGYHAARALRLMGRRDEARALVDTLLARPGLDASTLNLLRQERLALSRAVGEAVAVVLRAVGGQPGEAVAADGGELFDNRMSSEELLKLANDSKTAATLRASLAAAAWFRAELLQRPEVALPAARLSGDLTPALSLPASRYASAATAEERRDIVVLTAFARQFSPKVYQLERYQPGMPLPRNRTQPVEWCGFDGEFQAYQRSVERVPSLPLELQASAAATEELARLKAIGDGPTWLAREALARVRRHPGDPANAPLLKQVLALTHASLLCPLGDAAALRAQAQQLAAGR